MLPLALTLVLVLISFLCSAFVILRIIIPILPSHPLSRHSPSLRFPDDKALSPADKSHIWLASLDVIALIIFVWEALAEYFGGAAGIQVSSSPAAAVRLWVAIALRQTCLLVIAALILFHVRMGRSVSLGRLHWMLWIPTLLLIGVSTALASTLAASGVRSYFWGLLGYSAFIAMFSSAAFFCLIGTLIIIRRNLAAFRDVPDAYPSKHTQSEKPKQPFDIADIDALKDGDSWITSRASSHRNSISSFSFSTCHTAHSYVLTNTSSHMHAGTALSPGSLPYSTPPTPRSSSVSLAPPFTDCYHTGMTEDHTIPHDFALRPRMDSQSSWLTEPSACQSSSPMWSFPTSPTSSPCPSTSHSRHGFIHASARPLNRASGSVTDSINFPQELGGLGCMESASRIETAGLSPRTGDEVPAVLVYRVLGWMITIWIPMILALPYYITVHSSTFTGSSWAEYLLVFSVTVPSPLLAANILLRSPLPIPSGLFDTPADPPSIVMQPPSLPSTFNHAYKRSGIITVVEGRRSGDITKGDAMEGVGKLSRGLSLLHPQPKLSVIPIQNVDPEGKPVSSRPNLVQAPGRPAILPMSQTTEDESDVQEAIGMRVAECSFAPVGYAHQIGACTNDLSPSLPVVPDSKARDGMTVEQNHEWAFSSSRESEGETCTGRITSELGEIFQSPPLVLKGEAQSIGMRRKEGTRSSRYGFNLPSISLRRDSFASLTSWRRGLKRASERHRNIVGGDEPVTRNAQSYQAGEGPSSPPMSSTGTASVYQHHLKKGLCNGSGPPLGVEHLKFSSLDTLASSLEKEFEIIDTTQYEFDPSMDEVARSTPDGSKTRPHLITNSTPSLPLSRQQTGHRLLAPKARRVQKLKLKASKLVGLRRLPSMPSAPEF